MKHPLYIGQIISHYNKYIVFVERLKTYFEKMVLLYQPQLRKGSPDDEISLRKYITLMYESRITVTVKVTVTVMKVVHINSLNMFASW